MALITIQIHIIVSGAKARGGLQQAGARVIQQPPPFAQHEADAWDI